MTFKMPLNIKRTNNTLPSEKCRCDVHARNRAPKAPWAVWVHVVRGVHYTVSIYSAGLLTSQSKNKKLM